MFHVFGVNPEVEAAKIKAKLPDATREAVQAGLRLCKPREVADYDNRDIADRYAAMLRAQGWLEVSVKIQVLVPGSKDGGLPTYRWVPAGEIEAVDVSTQSRLKAIKDGGRFAPREPALL